MTRSSHAVAVLATAALVASSAAAAGAATLDGGQEGVTPQNSGQATVEGPDRAGLKWLSDLIEDRNIARNRALSFDSEGHVLVQVDYQDETNARVEALVAVNASDGTVAWELDGVEADCDVAASDDGMIFAQVAVGSEATSLIAIDAASGTVMDAKTYTPPETDDEPRMHACADGLSLLDDGTLVVVEDRGNDKSIRALDTMATPIAPLWHGTRTSSEVMGRAPASPDERTVYYAYVDTNDPRVAHVDAIDVATGAVNATAVVPGDTFSIQSGQGDTFVVDDAGGVVVSTRDGQGTGVGGDDTAHLTRLGSDLSEDWSLTIADDDPVYGSNIGFNSLVAAGDKVVGWYHGRLIAAVDLADGSSAWTFEPSSFTNNEGRIVADSAGNTYWGSFGGDWVQSVDAEGQLRWAFPDCAIGEPTELSAIGPIDAEGTVYAVNRVADPDGPDDQRVTAISQDGTLPQGTCEPEEDRLAGANRFETGIAISQDSFPEDGSADAVVLARSDEFADALSGTPLAVQENGPLLITPPDRLRDDVQAEIQRLLGDDTTKTVYLLGGEAALSAGVAAAVEALGYDTVRLAGADRIETAIEVAGSLDTIEAFLVTTGFDFPDALAAGVAAAHADGAVMLTFSEQRSPKTDAFMDANDTVPRFAIGGPAVRPYPEAEPVFGATRTETAVEVAIRFFDEPPVAGLARQDDFPDSLTGGAHVAVGGPDLARQGGPMLLTPQASLHDAPSAYLCDEQATLARLFVYGGEAAVSAATASAAAERIQGEGC